ncbi:chromatin assembly factor 1 subunit A-like [Homarus americanus]|uniref:chromatin assembly factor 1 subunit A-like n=1 Tax=Homarus americanus TaxID=6706 RepID=UPI001C47EB14|nr:chromatin assembly factor 1 subunit A-like [Homarus americanus]
MEVKKRKARFSVHEIDVLVDEVYRNRATLFSRLCSTITNERKMIIWQCITEKVNEVCTVQPRTADEVRRKWYYYLSDRKKDVSRRNKLKKTECPSLDAMYTPTDLKILELLGEVEATKTAKEEAVEGLVCEVDADALPLRPSSASSDYNQEEEEEEDITSRHHHHPLASEDDVVLSLGPSSTIKRESAFVNSYEQENPPAASSTTARTTTQQPTAAKRPRANTDDSDQDDKDDREFLQLEKRRVYLQECQLRLLNDIFTQMRSDAERNNAFQQAFLDIERQRLDIERAGSLK